MALFPHSSPPLLLLLLLLLLAGAAAVTSPVNGTCPVGSPTFCDGQCCSDKERCALKSKGGRYCENKLVVPITCAIVIPIAVGVCVYFHLQGRKRNGEWPFPPRPQETAAADAESVLVKAPEEAAAAGEPALEKGHQNQLR